ncbi:MAG: cytochrome b/b6 domain-containing protein [Hyphomonadaceae bacterium]|nr:cytochrome b/b6 domain-containing protein [Hyphomonadaceae bacterium]
MTLSASDQSASAPQTRDNRYTGVAIALHWAIALAIFGLIGVGWYMGDLPNDHPGKESLYQLHKSVGITVFLLTLARIVWRLLNPPPADAEGLTGWERALSHGVHIAFYVLMLAMPLSGWLYVSTAYDFDIPTVLYGIVSWPDIPFVSGLANEAGHGAVEFVHSKLAWVAIGLVVLHLAGAVKHEIDGEEGVLKRMIPGLFGKTGGPHAPSRGALSAFGGAFAVFLVVAGIPALAQGGGPKADLTSPETFAGANWLVNESAENSLAFSGLYESAPYAGEFARWSAQIAFDPENLDTSRVDVTVDLTTAETGKKLYTDSLKGAEWLDPGSNPTATVVLDNFAPAEADTGWGTAYTANAALTLKGATVTTPFQFQLEIDGDTARMEGSTTLSRAALDVGMQSDPGADWIADDVTVTVKLTATRNSD